MHKFITIVVSLFLLSCAGDDVAGVVSDASDEMTMADANVPDTTIQTTDSSLTPGQFDGNFDLLPANVGPILYSGGKITTAPINIYMIWYGTWEDGRTIEIVEDLLSNISGSDYWKTNVVYYQVGPGNDTPNYPVDNLDAAADAYDAAGDNDSAIDSGDQTKYYATNNISIVKTFHVGTPRGTNLYESDIGYIVNDTLIDNNMTPDPSGIYFVMTSKEISESQDWYPGYGFCSVYCGWHDYRTMQNVNVKFAFIGDVQQCPKDCSAEPKYSEYKIDHSPNDNWSADDMSSIIIHELSEMATDPFSNAWQDGSGNENGDLCAWRYGQLYVTDNLSVANTKIGKRDYLIQTNWTLLDDGGQNCSLGN